MTEVEFSRLLASFDATAKQLNEASDSVNSILEGVEKRLVAANVGLETWLQEEPLTATDAEGSTQGESSWTVQQLGFAKIGGTWCLAVKPIRVVTGFLEGDLDKPYENKYAAGSAIALTQASREARIEAVKLLPKLVERLREKAEAAVSAIEQAKRYVEPLDELDRLISLGKQKGFLTYDEVNDALPSDMVLRDQLDEIMMMFGAMDIEVVDSAKAGRLPSEMAPHAGESEESAEGKRKGFRK